MGGLQENVQVYEIFLVYILLKFKHMEEEEEKEEGSEKEGRKMEKES